MRWHPRGRLNRLAVFDTNVTVSAGVTPGGAPSRIIQTWVLKGRVNAVTSSRVVAEYRGVVLRPNFRRYGFPPKWLEAVIGESLRLPDPESWVKARVKECPDPDDLPFLALAHFAGAWLVTGNLKHFPQHIRDGVVVVSPSEYLKHLEGF